MSLKCFAVCSVSEAKNRRGLLHVRSLGMKQRLGIASALLGKPEFLVLDEPTNGLDPSNVKEIQEVILTLNKERNTTVLISSHILSHLYQLATDYIIIHDGKIIERITHEQLKEKCKRYVSIMVDNVSLAVTIIERQLGTSNFKVMPQGEIQIYDYHRDTREIARLLSKNGIVVSSITTEGISVDEYFINLIGGKNHA